MGRINELKDLQQRARNDRNKLKGIAPLQGTEVQKECVEWITHAKQVTSEIATDGGMRDLLYVPDRVSAKHLKRLCGDLNGQRLQLIDWLATQIEAWSKEALELLQPFQPAEKEVRGFIGVLRGILDALPVHPHQLRDIRAEIERLGLLTAARSGLPLAMGTSYADLLIVKHRLDEMLECLPAAKRIIKPFPTPAGATWGDVEIRFLSDHRIQIDLRTHSEVVRYAEVGFENSKTGNPGSAWHLLCELAKSNGNLKRPIAGKEISRVEKAVQALRKRLREYFRLQEDPFLDYRNVKCYQTKFKITFPEPERM